MWPSGGQLDHTGLNLALGRIKLTTHEVLSWLGNFLLSMFSSAFYLQTSLAYDPSEFTGIYVLCIEL